MIGGTIRDMLDIADGWRDAQGHVGHGRWVEGYSGTCWTWQMDGGTPRDMLDTADWWRDTQGHVGYAKRVERY